MSSSRTYMSFIKTINIFTILNIIIKILYNYYYHKQSDVINGSERVNDRTTRIIDPFASLI